jgi:hypothetical protein
MGSTPAGQFPSVPLECTKLPPLDRDASVRFREDGTGRDLRLMHVQTDDSLKKGL